MSQSMDLLMNQIMTGMVRCDILGDIYYVHSPSPTHKFEAELIKKNSSVDNYMLGMFSEAELINKMIEIGVWSDEEEMELKSMPSKIDAAKVDIYQKYLTFQSNRVKQLRNILSRMKNKQIELLNKRHAYDLYTSDGFAESEKVQYLVLKNTKDTSGNSIDVEEIPEWLASMLVNEYLKNRPTELSLRGLAKYGPWRAIWASGRHEKGVFGVPSSFLTEQQQGLIAWSKLYDNILEHPEPPSDEVINDDDLLDGWIIIEKNKREKDKNQKNANKYSNGAQEVYIPAESVEDAKRIDSMNTQDSSFTKKRRMSMLKQGKVVNEEHMPDSRQQIAIQAANQFKNKVKGQ